MKRIAISAALALALVLVLVVSVGGVAQADCFATNCAISEPTTGQRAISRELRRMFGAQPPGGVSDEHCGTPTSETPAAVVRP